MEEDAGTEEGTTVEDKTAKEEEETARKVPETGSYLKLSY
jgi:hypothetical protein